MTEKHYSREAALYDAEESRYAIDHRTDPAIAAAITLGTIAEHCVSKAAAIVPNVDNGPQLIADMYRTNVVDLVDLFRSYGANIDEATAAAIATALVDYSNDELRTYDAALLREDPPRFDPTWHRPRITTGRGVEVRGRRDGYIVGDTSRAAGDLRNRAPGAGPAHHGGYVRMSYAEALERANAWHYMLTGDTLELIGTDTYSWEQVVTWKPIALGSFVMRPEGAGSSLVGDGRKKRTNVPRSVSYGHDRYYVRTDLPGWSAWRVLKEYRTNVRVRLIDEEGNRVATVPGERVIGLNHRGEPITRPLPSVAVMGSVRMIGHKVTARPKVRKPKQTRTKRAAIVDVVDVDAVTAAMVEPITAAIIGKTAAAAAYRTENGTIIRYRVDVSAAVIAVQVTSTNADGVKVTKRTNVRSAAAAVAAVRNRTR